MSHGLSRLLAGIVLSLPAAAMAATPPSGTLTEAAPVLNLTGGPLSPSANAATANQCANDSTSDIYTLTVTLPSDFDTRRPNDSLRIDVDGVPSADLVLTLRTAAGVHIQSADNNATAIGETIIVDAAAGTVQYKVLVCLFAGAAPSYSATIRLSTTPVQDPPPPITGGPRLVTLNSPSGMGDSAGEPSIGYNLKNRRGMFIAGLQTLRVTPAEASAIKDAEGADLPLACPAVWTDVSTDITGTVSLDPILFTNQSLGTTGTNRTFVSQLTGANSAFAFSDDDGANWQPGQVGASNGGVDHQTVASGLYPATSATFPAVPPGSPGYAVYYCSQSIADAFCARSDTGGQTFNQGQPIGKATALGCATGDIGALHGHVRIAPDGALAMPIKSCAGKQGFVLSTDAGTTFSAKTVPGTTAGSTDPQLAWSKPGADGKIRGYFCMTDGDGKPKAAVTSDRGTTWSTTKDLGAAHGIKKAVFAQAIAGDADRAACAFIGTTTTGDSGATTFPGLWYGYVAYTFDGGANWTTVNVTPDDPVQGKGGICTSGTTCGANRNLLDFNEITLDEKGRVWFGYADGCTSTSCKSGATIERGAKATIARQIGGRSLYTAFDSEISTIPQPPCLLGNRDAAKSALTWVTPDDGGKAITGYKLYRATQVTGPYVLLATLPVRNFYDDLTADSDVPSYFYKILATYDGGEGRVSNILELTVNVPESVCTSPGLTILTDAANDPTDTVASHDVRSLSIAQPYFSNDDYKLYVHLKMTSLNPPTENTFWPINFCAPSFPCQDPNVAYGATNKFVTVRMTTFAPASGAAPGFELLVPTAAGATLGSRTVIALLPAGGSRFTPGGMITMVVNGTDLGLTKPNRGSDALSKFQVRIGVNVVAGTITPDNMPDSLGGAGTFATVAPSVCAPNTAPLADLQVAPSTLGKGPFTVQFTGVGTDEDVIDTIATFSLDYGDGSAPVAQSNGIFGGHTYSDYGNYPARLFVVDSRGKRSSNTSERVIVVYGDPEAFAGDDFSVNNGATAMLSAAGSRGNNGGTLNYAWTRVSGPAVTLSDSTTASPTFVTPAVCSDTPIEFQLGVANLAGADTDRVVVTVQHPIQPPIADSGANQQVDRERPATLDGSGSSHDSCETLSYAWTQVAGPRVTLSGADTATPSFTAPNVTVDVQLAFRLEITDSAGNFDSDVTFVDINSQVAPVGYTKILGGGVPLQSLVVLLLMAGLRRRPA